jgi:hypothetical protein
VPFPNLEIERLVITQAYAILNGEVGLIEGCIRMARLAHEVVPSWVDDPDFVVFGSIASETDHLPIGAARAQWSDAALAREDKNTALIEQSARSDVHSACTNIIRRFRGA